MTKLLWGSGLALLFLVAHLLALPSTLEDVDSLNFALGLHDFDPAKHQPHPPGYPIFMALGKVSRAVVPSDAKALAVLGAIFGALSVFPLLALFEDLQRLELHHARAPAASGSAVAALATALAVASPPFWFNALRPMSDIPGLALTLAAQALLASAFVRQRLNPSRTPEALADSGKRIVLGAFLSALAIGMRSQAVWLTLPLLMLVLLQRVGRGAAGALLGSMMAFSIGVLAWAIPLVIATGGVMAYRAALNAQGGEDFSGVDMLYRNPTPRRLAFSLLETFIYPWASQPLGWIVFVLAATGIVLLMLRARRALLLLSVAALPYAAFHMLFQETATTRYALPLLPFVAFLAVRALSLVPRMLPAAVTLLVLWSLAITLPAARVYAREGSPAFAAIEQLHDALGSEPEMAIGMHQGLARAVQTQDFGRALVLKAPVMREWLELTRYWREGNTAPVWFFADPARTDLELIDPLSRHVRSHLVWNFPRQWFIGGVRPDIVDLVRIDSPPAWFAEEGWHLTSETLNMSERLRRHEGVAYIRSRPGVALLVIGGESTAIDGKPAGVSLTLNDTEVDRWDVPAGAAFFKRIPLEPGALARDRQFNRLVASYAAGDGRAQPVRLTQLAVGSPNEMFFVQHEGWNEIEYSKELQRRWRWTTGRAVTFVNGASRDLVLTLAGESPLRYFGAAPHVTVRAGSRVLATAAPAEDFEIEVDVPFDALAAADGMLTIETDKTFVPYERSGSADRRTLGLRILRFELR